MREVGGEGVQTQPERFKDIKQKQWQKNLKKKNRDQNIKN